MVGIVETDAQELADIADARPQPRRRVDFGKARRVDFAEPGKRIGTDRRAVDVIHMCRQIADRPRCVDHTGFFLPSRAKSQQFHEIELAPSLSAATVVSTSRDAKRVRRPTLK
jgi:hypothetical protein